VTHFGPGKEIWKELFNFERRLRIVTRKSPIPLRKIFETLGTYLNQIEHI
jgi:hypothetical protein